MCVKNKRIEPLEINRSLCLHDIQMGKKLLNKDTEIVKIKRTMEEWGFVWIENFCLWKCTIKKLKGQATEYGKIFIMCVSDRELISRNHIIDCCLSIRIIQIRQVNMEKIEKKFCNERH